MSEKFDQLGVNKKNNQRLIIFINQFFGFILIFIAILVILAGYFIVIKEQYNNYVYKKDVQLVDLEKKINQLKQQEYLFVNYQDNLINFTPKEENLINLVLPQYFDLPSVIVQLNNMAKNYNIYINNIDINKNILTENDDKRLKEANLELDLLVNNYDNWKNFLAALENSAIIFNVLAVDFSNDSSIYKLSLLTYYYK